jgi:hypothetical protein
MTDVKLVSINNLVAADKGDGSFLLKVAPESFTESFRDAFNSLDTTNTWTLTKAAGDIVALDGNTAGCSYLVISLDPLTTGTKTTLETRSTFGVPFDVALGLHMSQRALGQEISAEIIGDEVRAAEPAELAISAIQQTTTTLTVTTTDPHGLVVGARFGVYGVADCRFNYPALVVASVTSSTVFTATAGPGGTIASVTAGPFAGGFVYSRAALDRCPNGSSMIFENATVTNASYYVKSGGADLAPIGGTLAGSHSVTVGTTASIQAATSPYNYAFRPTNEYRTSFLQEGLQWSDSLVADNTVAQSTSRARAIQVIPNPNIEYNLQFRAVNDKGKTIPTAQIVSISKSGSTTATVVTDVPHGLTTADLIVGYGVRDFTANFPALTAATAVASVIDATSFTVVWGPSATVTSYGGYVARVQGGNLMSALGALTMAIQNATVTATTLTLTGSATWTYLVGDYINVVGCRNNVDGATMGVDGAYRARLVSTTTLELEPIGSTVLPGAFAATDCGGGTIRRTDLRVSYVRVFDYDRLRVESLARPSGDTSAAAPVVIQGGTVGSVTTVSTVSTVSSVTAIVGASIAEDAAATANPLIVGGVVRTAASPIVTPVAGDSMRFTTTTDGRLVTSPYTYPEASWQYVAAASGIVNTTTAVTIKAAAGASLRNYITGIDYWSEALTNATEIAIRDGAGGSAIWRAKIGTGGLLAGRSIIFPTPIRGTAATLLEVVTLTASGAGAVYFNATGFVAP